MPAAELKDMLNAMLTEQIAAIKESVKTEIQTATAGLQGQISAQGAELAALRAAAQAQELRLGKVEASASATPSMASTSSFRFSGAGGTQSRRLDGAIDLTRDFEQGDPCVKFVGCFPRPLLLTIREAHFEQLKVRFPDELGDGRRVEVQYHGMSHVCKVKFLRADTAAAFQRKANQVATDTDAHELVSAKQATGDNFTFEQFRNAFNFWGISDEQAQTLIEVAAFADDLSLAAAGVYRFPPKDVRQVEYYPELRALAADSRQRELDDRQAADLAAEPPAALADAEVARTERPEDGEAALRAQRRQKLTRGRVASYGRLCARRFRCYFSLHRIVAFAS
ncbi:unnamed protein product [Prorocentrum cordatum]|uniref:Uncharacterized protein n=1 Tax=Prorocentrum cordatum TaxID=2364126 RepID=A0ABN9U416_9DINO|nr:unnamed protein product [Polarella glacialis]